MSDENKPKATKLAAYSMPDRYTDNDFWTRGAKSRQGAPSEKLIFIAVGHALSNWQHVEMAAATLFQQYVESASIAAQRAYGSILGARAREAALRQASETYFLLRLKLWHESTHSTVRAMKRCSNIFLRNYAAASARRNDIAHGVAYELSVADTDSRSWFLVAPNYQSQRTTDWIDADMKLRAKKGLKLGDKEARFGFNKIYHENSEYVFGVKEIKVLAGKFAFLYADLLDFIYTMRPDRPATTPQLHALAKAMSK